MWTEARQQFARTVADRIALSLINLNLQESLRQQATRDPLTGLFNRRYLEETLEREVARVTRALRPLGVIMLDLDHFKHFNDTFGHAAGDTLLEALGALLKANVRGEDIACRYGGEEFLLILPEAPLGVTQARANRLREAVKHSWWSTTTGSLWIRSRPPSGWRNTRNRGARVRPCSAPPMRRFTRPSGRAATVWSSPNQFNRASSLSRRKENRAKLSGVLAT